MQKVYHYVRLTFSNDDSINEMSCNLINYNTETEITTTSLCEPLKHLQKDFGENSICIH